MPIDEKRFSPENESLSIRLDNIRQRMERAAEKSGRELLSVTLVAVTKTVPSVVINQALELGIEHLGENKVQEAQKKRPELNLAGRDITHHLIGHLQTNKANKAVELFDVIQTLDRISIVESMQRIGSESGRRLACLVEIKMGAEPSKTGFSISEATQFISNADKYSALRLDGVMMIAPWGLDSASLQNCFREAKIFFDRHRDSFSEHPVLSMGMSDDFEMAIEEGSTMIRVGRALFGERIV